MCKDITEEILLKAGFTKKGQDLFGYKEDRIVIYIEVNTYPLVRHWRCSVDNEHNNSDTDIQTIDQFNKLMDIMDIDFKLKEK